MFGDVLDILVKEKQFFVQLFIEHLQISLSAVLIASIFGGLCGILISEYKKASQATLGTVNFLYTIPSISMLGFLIPFSGIGNATAIITLTIYALLPMVRNTYTGITQLDGAIIEAAEGMGSTRLQLLYKIKLPLAFPIIFSGIRSMVTMTIALGGIASFIGAGGLGVAIYRGITTNNAALTMAGSLLIALLALVMDYILGILEKIFAKRPKSEQKNSFFIKRSGTVAAVGLTVVAVIFCANLFFLNTAKMVHIATKPMTEQYVLSEMLALLIEQETDLQVKLTQGVGGGTANIHPAMEQGEFDMYIEYTGTGWNMILKRTNLYSENLFSELQQNYMQNYAMQWVGMFGFNNTFGIAVRSGIAQKYNVKTYSDLQAIGNKLVFGAEYDFFGREDGFDMLRKRYELTFADTMDMDIGLKYQAINQGKIDVMNIFTTDGQLSVSDVVVLEDDKHMYPSYLCGIIIRMDVLKKYPELTKVFDLLAGRISDKDITSINYQVESLGKTPQDVAKAFLQQLGLLKPLE